jgi:hypothetical protein
MHSFEYNHWGQFLRSERVECPWSEVRGEGILYRIPWCSNLFHTFRLDNVTKYFSNLTPQDAVTSHDEAHVLLIEFHGLVKTLPLFPVVSYNSGGCQITWDGAVIVNGDGSNKDIVDSWVSDPVGSVKLASLIIAIVLRVSGSLCSDHVQIWRHKILSYSAAANISSQCYG